MVDLFGLFQNAVGIAVLAERVLPDIRVSDPLPCPAVFLSVSRSLISVVELLSLLSVFGAVLLAGLRQVGAAVHAARAPWTVWHRIDFLPELWYISARCAISLMAGR